MVPTRILHLEDSLLDAELASQLLESSIPCVVHHVSTREAFENAIGTLTFDVILADYEIPGYSGAMALDHSRKVAPGLPFLFLSGRMGEESAIDSLKLGATDYVLKTRIERLVPAVIRAIEEAKARELASEAARRVRESETQFREVAEGLPQIVWVTRPDGYHEYFNQKWYDYTGITSEDSTGWSWIDCLHPEDRELSEQRWRIAIASGEPYEIEYRLLSSEETYRWFLCRALPLRSTTGEIKRWFGTCTDIEDKKRAEVVERHRAAQLQLLAAAASRIHAARDVNSVLGVITEEARLLTLANRASATLESGVSMGVGSVNGHHGVDHATWPPPEPIVEASIHAPLLDRGGRCLGQIQVFTNTRAEFSRDDSAILTQLANMASVALENARLYQELREDDRRKDEFLAMLAHELRNPLASISTASSVGVSSRAESDWAFQLISRQVGHLTRLIDDLLDVSRITSGKVVLKPQPILASAVMSKAIETVLPLVSSRSHQVIWSGGEALWVSGDPVRLEQILVNLLTNSAKYSESHGRIELTTRLIGEEVVFSVRDNGVGIAPDVLPNVFNPFVQGDRTLARSEGGLGIGLTLVKRLAELHGGRVSVQSDGIGLGSEFSVFLPVLRPEVIGDRPDGDVSNQVSGSPRRVLVVDDNLDTLDALNRLLALDDHIVELASDGNSALKKAESSTFDVILLDIGLPGLDGFEVASRIRLSGASRSSVVVALSGYGQPDDRARSMASGFDDHLVKPVKPDTLRAFISGVPLNSAV